MRIIAEEDIDIKAIAAKRKAKQVKARSVIDKELGYDKAMTKVDDISNSKNPVIELLAYTKKVFSAETFNANSSEKGKAAALVLACLVLNNVIGRICANLIISLLKKRGYAAAEGLREPIFMACAGIIAAPIVEEAAKVTAKKNDSLELFLMFFNAAEFTNYVIMKPNLPNVLARVYLVVLHNLSGVTLNNDDLSMGEKIAINYTWHVVNNTLAVIVTLAPLIFAMKKIGNDENDERLAEELIPKEPKLFNIRVETPRNKAFYEKVDNIAKSVEKMQNSKLLRRGQYVTPLAAGALGVGAYSLLRRKRDEQN